MNNDGDSSQRLADLYLAAKNRWKGCDWTTKFGRLELELRGMFAKQARLLADATSGEEAKAWTEATRWLEQVEQDACAAQAAAATAVELIEKRDFAAGLAKIEEAYRLESRYRQSVIWKPLREHIAEQVSQHSADMRP